MSFGRNIVQKHDCVRDRPKIVCSVAPGSLHISFRYSKISHSLGNAKLYGIKLLNVYKNNSPIEADLNSLLFARTISVFSIYNHFQKRYQYSNMVQRKGCNSVEEENLYRKS